jgi:hypothetical protein
MADVDDDDHRGRPEEHPSVACRWRRRRDDESVDACLEILGEGRDSSW